MRNFLQPFTANTRDFLMQEVDLFKGADRASELRL
jgi:hypothetical protein